MASIFNQDIGLNYKGIITLGSTINQNLSGTLQYLTDGDGNNLPLQVSTTGLQFNAIETIYRNAAGTNIAMNVWGNLGRVAIGGLTTNYTPSAPLQVRGDALSPIARFEDNAGTLALQVQHSINGIGLLTSGSWVGYNSSTTQLVGIQGGYYYILNSTSRFQINLATNETRNLGNLFVGSVAVTSTARLHVRGDGTNPYVRLETPAGASVYEFNVIQFDIGAASTNMNVNFRSNSSTFTSTQMASTFEGFRFNFGTTAFSSNGSWNKIYFNQTYTLTGAVSSNINEINLVSTFNANANTGVFNGVNVRPTINQTGGANGITRGLYVAPTLTAAADFRAYDSDITFANASGSNKLSLFNANYTINNTGTTSGSIVTGIKLNATETSITGTTHNLMDLQVGGQSRLRYTPTANSGLQITRTDNAYVSVTLNNNGITVHQNLGVTSNYYVATVGSVLYTVNSWTIGSNAVNFARLHVRGDGTNPIARFETSAGGASYIINSTGTAHTFTGSVDVSDVVNVAATRGYFWTNRGGIATSGDGIILLRNNNNTDFNRLNFGGNTSSFPSLKRNTIALEARLADDSDFTFIQGKLRTETNFTSEPAVMASGYIVLYDLDGTAYKVLATAL
jgi:hypothetical protein